MISIYIYITQQAQVSYFFKPVNYLQIGQTYFLSLHVSTQNGIKQPITLNTKNIKNAHKNVCKVDS